MNINRISDAFQGFKRSNNKSWLLWRATTPFKQLCKKTFGIIATLIWIILGWTKCSSKYYFPVHMWLKVKLKDWRLTQRYLLSTFVWYKREFFFFTVTHFLCKNASKQARNSRKKLKCIPETDWHYFCTQRLFSRRLSTIKISYTSTSTIINHHQATILASTVFSTWKMFCFDGNDVSHATKTENIWLCLFTIDITIPCDKEQPSVQLK